MCAGQGVLSLGVRRTACADALLGSGLSPGFRETSTVLDVVATGLLLATFPASLW